MNESKVVRNLLEFARQKVREFGHITSNNLAVDLMSYVCENNLPYVPENILASINAIPDCSCFHRVKYTKESFEGQEVFDLFYYYPAK